MPCARFILSAQLRSLLDGFAAHLNHGCVGSVSEIFDAERTAYRAGLRGAGVERRGECSAALQTQLNRRCYEERRSC